MTLGEIRRRALQASEAHFDRPWRAETAGRRFPPKEPAKTKLEAAKTNVLSRRHTNRKFVPRRRRHRQRELGVGVPVDGDWRQHATAAGTLTLIDQVVRHSPPQLSFRIKRIKRNAFEESVPD